MKTLSSAHVHGSTCLPSHQSLSSLNWDMKTLLLATVNTFFSGITIINTVISLKREECPCHGIIITFLVGVYTYHPHPLICVKLMYFLVVSHFNKKLFTAVDWVVPCTIICSSLFCGNNTDACSYIACACYSQGLMHLITRTFVAWRLSASVYSCI